MAKYKKVRCIAFNIKPGTREKSGSLVYLGKKSAELDIEKRCIIMKNAVLTAYDELTKLLEGQRGDDERKMAARGSSNTVVINPVLTIFMAPEFFFRGADGAYPIEKIDSIMPELARTVRDPKFKDWLFVYGTAIGYRKVEEIITKVVAYDGTGAKSCIVVDQLPYKKYDHCEVHEFVNSTVEKVEKIDAHQVRLTMDSKVPLDWCTHVSLIYGRDNERTEECDILDRGWDGNKATVTVRQRSTPIEQGWAAELSADPMTKQEVEDDRLDASMTPLVQSVEYAGDGTARVTLDTELDIGEQRNVRFARLDGTETRTYSIIGWRKDGANHTVIMFKSANARRLKKCPEVGCNCGAFVPNGVDPQRCDTCTHYHVMDPIAAGWEAQLHQRVLQLTDKAAVYTPGRLLRLKRKPGDARTEVFNIAFIQRGGPGAREILVAKQQYSGIDFTELKTWNPATKTKVGTGRFMIHGEYRGLIHTEAIEPGGKSVESDISGDPVFDIDGCTIGMEVCLDHRRGRLQTYYTRPEGAGKPRPQVLLIPSWGMSIGGGPVVSQANGVAFNVDGQRGDSAVRISDGTYGCDNHRDQKPAGPGNCPDCRWYYCPNCNRSIPAPDRTNAGACPGCNGALDDVYICTVHDNLLFAGPGTCDVRVSAAGATCNKMLRRQEKKYELIGPSVHPEVEAVTVNLRSWGDWLTVTQKNYFLGKGSISIYPELPIPKP